MGQGPSLSMFQMSFSKEHVPCSAPCSCLDILCGIQAGLYSLQPSALGQGAGDSGHQCPQLPLKQTQADCALPWARHVLLDTSVAIEIAPMFLFYSVLSSLCEIHEMRFQGFALVYLPSASL